MNQICINTRDEYIKVDLDKMLYAVADDNYISLHFLNGQNVVVCLSLLKLSQMIVGAYGTEKTKFIRIGRKYIVNRLYIMQINLLKQVLVLSDMEEIKPIAIPVPKEALKALRLTLVENIKNTESK